MKDQTQQTIDSLVLTDNGDDVTGYMMDNWYMTEKLVAQHQSERREEGARERKLRRSFADPSEGDPSAETASGFRGVLTYIFANLRSITPDAAK